MTAFKRQHMNETVIAEIIAKQVVEFALFVTNRTDLN